MSGRPKPLVLALMGIVWSAAPLAVSAQNAGEAPQTLLRGITVSATPLSRESEELAAPVSILDEEELLTKRRATLGETLEQEPGITATHFGAGASRPIIRGMDAGRVKVLSDGAEVQDASTISPDHAVGVEPMLSRRVEVLRGPATLLYGGGAVGGVVNVLDNKIPTAVPEGAEGSVELRGATAPREAAGAFSVTAGGGGFALHAEGLKRGASDYKVGSGWAGGDRVEGSYNHTETGSVGLSWIGDRGYVGLAYTSQHNRYGLPGHNHEFEGCHTHGPELHCGEHGHDHGDDDDDEDEGHEDHDHEHGVPFVKLRSQRWDVRGELRDPFAGFTRLRVRAGLTDYQHDEIEGDEVATTFKNKAHDGRVELEHAPLGGLRGVIGAQTTRRDFSALGEEKFVEPTLTRNHGIFALEEYTVGDWRFEGGLRHEWQRISAQESGSRAKHRGTSMSAGAVWKFAPEYTLGMSLSRSHRLPTAEELYADGLHLATSTYEVGNAGLKKETSNNIDLTLRKFAGPTTFSVSVFHNKVDNFIYGRTLDVHEGLQLLEYAQHDATFTGIEAQVRHRIDKVFGVSLMGDYVRARLDGGAGNLPRIPAYRVGTRLDARWQAWNGDVELAYVGRQDKVAEFETETAGYAMLNLGVGYEGRVANTRYQIYLRANNLTNKLAYRHTSFIKNAAPLMGRNIVMGVRLSF